MLCGVWCAAMWYVIWYVMSCDVPCHSMQCDMMWCNDVMWWCDVVCVRDVTFGTKYDVMCYAMCCHVMWWNMWCGEIMWCDVICNVMSCHVMSCGDCMWCGAIWHIRFRMNFTMRMECSLLIGFTGNFTGAMVMVDQYNPASLNTTSVSDSKMWKLPLHLAKHACRGHWKFKRVGFSSTLLGSSTGTLVSWMPNLIRSAACP